MRRLLALAIVIWSLITNVGGSVTQENKPHITNDDIPDKEPIIEDDKPLTNGLYGRRMTKTQTGKARIIAPIGKNQSATARIIKTD